MSIFVVVLSNWKIQGWVRKKLFFFLVFVWIFLSKNRSWRCIIALKSSLFFCGPQCAYCKTYSLWPLHESGLFAKVGLVYGFVIALGIPTFFGFSITICQEYQLIYNLYWVFMYTEIKRGLGQTLAVLFLSRMYTEDSLVYISWDLWVVADLYEIEKGG